MKVSKLVRWLYNRGSSAEICFTHHRHGFVFTWHAVDCAVRKRESAVCCTGNIQIQWHQPIEVRIDSRYRSGVGRNPSSRRDRLRTRSDHRIIDYRRRRRRESTHGADAGDDSRPRPQRRTADHLRRRTEYFRSRSRDRRWVTTADDQCVNKYVGPPDCRAEVYAGRVACCCPLVSHGEYADGTDRQTDRRTLHCALC